MGSMATDPHIGTSIKRARERKRWSQRQLADVLGVDRKTIDNWENGRTSPRSSIGAIEEALDVNLTDGQSVVTPEASSPQAREDLRDQLRRLESLAREVRARLDDEEGRDYDDRRRRGA